MILKLTSGGRRVSGPIGCSSQGATREQRRNQAATRQPPTTSLRQSGGDLISRPWRRQPHHGQPVPRQTDGGARLRRPRATPAMSGW